MVFSLLSSGLMPRAAHSRLYRSLTIRRDSLMYWSSLPVTRCVRANRSSITCWGVESPAVWYSPMERLSATIRSMNAILSGWSTTLPYRSSTSARWADGNSPTSLSKTLSSCMAISPSRQPVAPKSLENE